MVDLTIKNARKKSEDPIQEALRAHKDSWNHETSLLIAQLIAFKKGLNGRGESKVGLPPGSIKDPVSREVASYLDQLADRYNKLITDAHHIIDEQNNYSENRKKSLKEQTADFEVDILKIASWWGSRALTYTKNQYLNPKYWLSSDKAIEAKMMMLKVSVDLIKQLKNIDNNIVSKNINAIPNAIFDFDKLISAFNKLLVSNIKKLYDLNKKDEKIEENKLENSGNIPTTDQSIKPEEFTIGRETARDESDIPLELSGKIPSENLLSAKRILEDNIFTGRLIQLMNLLNLNKDDILLFELGIKELRKSLDNISISGKGSLEEINKSYDDLKALSSKILNIKDSTFSNQLNDAEKLLIEKSSSVSFEIEKLAKNFINRWIKRQKLKILPDSDDRIRLEASKKVLNLIELIDAFQNILEKNEQSLDVITDRFLSVANELGMLADDLYYLGKTHNDEYEQSRLNGKPTTHVIKLELLNRLKKLKSVFETLPSELK